MKPVAEDVSELEQQEADCGHTRRRTIDNFLMLARNAQADADRREQEEQRQIENEEKAWDETIEHIRQILDNSDEFGR